MKKLGKILVISITSILFLTGMLGASATVNGDPGGLTPGFWKNLNKHQIYWTYYHPYNDTVGEVFDLPAYFSSLNVTLIEALKFGGGDDLIGMARNLIRHAVAGILNDAHPDMDYQYDGDVISDVNAALDLDRDTMEEVKNALDEANNYGFSF